MSRTDPDFRKRGPYAVGVIHTEIPSSVDPLDSGRLLPTEIWYPAADGASDTHDAPHPLGMVHQASYDLPARPQPAPLVAFSHGNSGFGQQSTFLTTHLASWGYVVAAPDHVGNTFVEMLALEDEDERRAVHLRARSQRPHDITGVIRALLDEAHERDRLPPLESNRLGVLGHSFGGWTSLKIAALEDRIRSVCCLAPVSEPFVGRKAFDAEELPLASQIETLIVAARDDVLVDLDSSIQPLFERLGPGANLDVIDGADHFHFCDGIETLHKMHENNPRPNQLRPTRPLAELRSENEMHEILNERVGRFFEQSLGGDHR